VGSVVGVESTGSGGNWSATEASSASLVRASVTLIASTAGAVVA
jgi:hypothetical protein